MIVRVWGHSNGTEILFSKSDRDLWTVTVPSVEDGRYIVDVYAENDYGVQAYVAKILFIYSGHKFTMRILERGYSANTEMNTFISKFVSQFYEISDIKEDISSGIKKKYEGTIEVGIKGGYIGEYQVCS